MNYYLSIAQVKTRHTQMAKQQDASSLYSMRKKPTQVRSKATVDAIMIAARRLLFEIGYEKTTTNTIAERAGVSIGTLYEYFPSKGAIFAEIRRRHDRKMFNPARISMDAPETLDVEGWLRLHGSMHLQYVRTNLPLHAALLNEVPRHLLRPEEFFVHKHYVPWVAQFLRAHQEELDLLGSCEEVAKFIAHMWMATIDDYVLHSPEKLDDPAFEDMIVNLLRRFISL